jgi:hypothetical protein
MTLPIILAPLFVHVVFAFFLGFWFAFAAAPFIRSGQVQPRDIDLRQPNWPRPVQQINNSFTSQFEVPLVFYVLTILAIITKHADVLFVVMAWIFVLSRLAHAFVHTTSNNVRWRGAFFGLGALVLGIMWLIFIARIMLDLP